MTIQFPIFAFIGEYPVCYASGCYPEDSKGVPPLAARSGANTPIAESNKKYEIHFAAYDPTNKLVFIGHHKKSGLWLFNGGHIDKNETPKQALKREIKEEWGIDMDVKNLAPKLLTITNIVSNPAKRPCQTHYDIWFFVPQDRGKFAPDNSLLSQEFYEAGWKTFAEARQLAKDPNTLKGINEIEKI